MGRRVVAVVAVLGAVVARGVAEEDASAVFGRAQRAVRALEATAGLASSRVDHGCRSPQRGGKDPCACQLRCSDLQCSNARASCRNEFAAWCTDVDTNTAKRVEKRVATLKRGGPAWRVDASARGPFGRLGVFVALVGEQKAGTTLAYDAILRGAGVRPATNGRKEQHFFSSHHVIDDCRAEGYVRGLVGGGGGGGGRRPVVDATPDYLADPIAALHVAYLVPSARVVALVRDPVARAYAAWDQNRRSNQEDRSFAAAAAAELPVATRCAALAVGVADVFARVAANATAPAAHGLVEYVERCATFLDGRPRNCWVDKTYGARPACKRYLYKGLYGEHVAVWAALFPPHRVGVLAAERLFDAASRGPAVARPGTHVGKRRPSDATGGFPFFRASRSRVGGSSRSSRAERLRPV